MFEKSTLLETSYVVKMENSVRESSICSINADQQADLFIGNDTPHHLSHVRQMKKCPKCLDV